MAVGRPLASGAAARQVGRKSEMLAPRDATQPPEKFGIGRRRNRQSAIERERAAKEERARLRNQAYEDEQRRLDLQERKAEVAVKRAKADRANDYIDRELRREDARTDVIRSEADSNRNLSEGGREMLKGIGKGAEKKSWW